LHNANNDQIGPGLVWAALAKSESGHGESL